MIEPPCLPVFRAARNVLLFLLLFFSLSACTGTAPASPEPAPTSLPSPPAGTSSAAQATLEGTVVSASDVAGQPGAPLADQLVLLLPEAEAPALLDRPPAELTDEALRFMQATVERLPDGLSVLRTGPAGTFTTSVAAGDYLLCLADAEASSPPYSIRGCARLTLRPGETASVEISTMFGEIVLTRPR